MLKNKLHPGKFLQELLDNYNISACQLSKNIFVQQSYISGILKGKKTINCDTAIRLGKYFNTSAQYWLNLKNSYNLSNCNTDDYYNIKPIQKEV
jgi:antitoxin HigA-1